MRMREQSSWRRGHAIPLGEGGFVFFFFMFCICWAESVFCHYAVLLICGFFFFLIEMRCFCICCNVCWMRDLLFGIERRKNKSR
ncbi:hypothetical protein J3E68DRAFT_420213 [Trichoderma sp. SZMC 28012]